MSDDKKEKKDKESPEIWWGLGILTMVLLMSIGTWFTWLLWPKTSLPPKPTIAAPAVADYPLCAGGKYDLSNKRSGEVVIDFGSDCVSEVVLPFQIAFRTEPSSDVKIIFLDGKSYVDGPNRRVWYGYERSSTFTVRGINSNGIMKISLGEKR